MASGRARELRSAACVVAVAAVGVVLIDVRVNALEDRARRDLAGAAQRAGLRYVTDVRLYYPFWTENLGLASRNEEPLPYGYGSLDVELDGCLLRSVAFSSTPDTRSWRPRPVRVHDVRFLHEHVDPARPGAIGPGSFHRVEFTRVDQLRAALRRDLGGGVCPSGSGAEINPPAPAVPAEPPFDGGKVS